MEEALLQLGFNQKESRIYLVLLKRGPMAAATIAEAVKEKRTNIYMVLEKLINSELVIAEKTGAKQEYSVADPGQLRRLLAMQHDRYKQAAAALETVMPQIKSQYSLLTDKPGVIHMAGMTGFRALLEDMVRSETEVLLVASNDVPAGSEELKELRNLLKQRKAAGVQTRALFHRDGQSWLHQRIFAERGIELRFLGNNQFKGEVVIYEDNTVFTVYDPSLVVTVITNAQIAQTMKLLFEELWQRAETD